MTVSNNKHNQDYTEKEEVYFDSARMDIIAILPDQINKVLEVGAGTGATLGYIRDKWNVTKTVAIEPFASAAKLAEKHVDLVLNKAVEDVGVGDLGDAPFDLILCLDVLEHLKDPWSEVEKLTQLLSPGGKMIASLPNVNHFSVILPLIFKNEWTLTDAGILDRTHLRFFVKTTAVELMASPDLELVDICTNLPWRGGLTPIINRLTLRLFERFFAQQYIITVQKKLQ